MWDKESASEPAISHDSLVSPSRSSRLRTVEDLAEDFRQAVIARSSLPLWVVSRRPVRDAVGILMYHRTSPVPAGLPRPTFNVTPDRLRMQLAGLLDRGYRPWPLRDVLQAMDAGRPIPPKVFVVTFDDGHASNYLGAWPVLKELRVPATIFVATAYLDSTAPFPFDDWSAAGQSTAPPAAWLPLTAAQCDEMLADGLVDLGSHTHTHQDFRGRPEAFQRDVETSLALLRERFGISQAAFAFPWGRRSRGHAAKELEAAAGRSGALCAVTTESELVRPNSDRFDLGRFTATQTDTPATLAAKIDGCYTRTRDFCRRLARPVIFLGAARRLAAGLVPQPSRNLVIGKGA